MCVKAILVVRTTRELKLCFLQIFQSQKKVQEETFQLLEVMSRALPLLIDVDKFETADNLKKAMIRIKETMVQAVNFAVKWARMQARHSITRGMFL